MGVSPLIGNLMKPPSHRGSFFRPFCTMPKRRGISRDLPPWEEVSQMRLGPQDFGVNSHAGPGKSCAILWNMSECWVRFNLSEESGTRFKVGFRAVAFSLGILGGQDMFPKEHNRCRRGVALPYIPYIQQHDWWFRTCFVPFSWECWECHHPKWRHIFQKGRAQPPTGWLPYVFPMTMAAHQGLFRAGTAGPAHGVPLRSGRLQ